jgi:phosphate starvation-inducible protein PhoH
LARKPKSNGSVRASRKVTSIDPFEDTFIPKRRNDRNTNLSVSITITPKTEPQRQMIEAYCSGMNIAAIGSAGTGKTFLAVSLALQDLLSNRISKIYIVRSAVQSRDIGFTPGSEKEKLEPYMLPYKSMVNEILGCGTAWETLSKKGMIEFMSTSFIRGVTLKDCVIILDEAQNTDYPEFSSVITRAGENARFIACGDTRQSDMERHREKTGFFEVIKVLETMKNYFEIINFLPQDIVRSGLVKAWIMADEAR